MRTCVFMRGVRRTLVCASVFGGSLSVWVLEGVWDVSFLLTSLSPWRSWIYVSLVSAAAPKAHTNTHSHTNTYTHTLLRDSGRDAGSCPPPRLKVGPWQRASRGCMCVKVLWWGPRSELTVCFQSHYYDRLFTERGRLQLLSALLLVPQYKQPHQHDLLLLMKSTSFLSTYLLHLFTALMIHHTLELLASLKATWNGLMSAVVCPVPPPPS